jgi:hypothetical protein
MCEWQFVRRNPDARSCVFWRWAGVQAGFDNRCHMGTDLALGKILTGTLFLNDIVFSHVRSMMSRHILFRRKAHDRRSTEFIPEGIS